MYIKGIEKGFYLLNDNIDVDATDEQIENFMKDIMLNYEDSYNEKLCIDGIIHASEVIPFIKEARESYCKYSYIVFNYDSEYIYFNRCDTVKDIIRYSKIPEISEEFNDYIRNYSKETTNTKGVFMDSIAHNNLTSLEVEEQATPNKTLGGFSMAKKILNKNKKALKEAGTLELSNIVLKQVKNQIKPAVPVMMRGYVDHEIGDIIVANLCNFLAENTTLTENNSKAILISEEMMKVAMLNFIQSFNLNEKINEFMEDKNVEALFKSLTEDKK